MVEPFALHGDTVWLKHYGMQSRRIRLGALNFVTRWLSLSPLRPPPHHVGEAAKQVEARRLRELDALGVVVPSIVGEGRDALMLSHVGDTLATCLRRVRGDVEHFDALVGKAMQAIVAVHRKGAYLGQPLPRNMTFNDGVIGFLDFEEDPLEVMSLPQAQARDWLMFAYGVSKYYDQRPDALASLLAGAMKKETPRVVEHARGAWLIVCSALRA